MEVCSHCGEVIVWEDDHWITVEGTLYCVLNQKDAHHMPPWIPQRRVVDVRQSEPVELP